MKFIIIQNDNPRRTRNPFNLYNFILPNVGSEELSISLFSGVEQFLTWNPQ